MKNKKLTKSIMVAVLGLSLTTAVAPPAEAFSIGNAIGAVIGVSAQYAAINKQVSYYNGKGRGEFLNQTKQRVGVNYEARANQQLDDIMSRLSAAIAVDDPSIKKEPYNHFVNNQDSFNAFCTLGHNMSVNIGLFKTLNYNEDEIAFVVAHEMGHGQHNDPANGSKRAFPMSVLAAVVGSQVGNSAEAIGVTLLNNLGSAKLVTLPMEKSADKFAFEYAPKAGYNPGAGAALWQRVMEKMGDNKQSFIGSVFNPSDHPGNIKRRDTYSSSLTKYSNNVVKVDNSTGVISVYNQAIGVPNASATMSKLERAYLVAGNMATVYKNKLTAKPTASHDGNYVYLNSKAIMSLNSGDLGDTWVTNLNHANNGRKTPKITAEKINLKAAQDGKNEKATPSSFRAKVDARKAAEGK